MNISQIDRTRHDRQLQDVKPVADPRIDLVSDKLREVQAQEKAARERLSADRDKGRIVDRYA